MLHCVLLYSDQISCVAAFESVASMFSKSVCVCVCVCVCSSSRLRYVVRIKNHIRLLARI